MSAVLTVLAVIGAAFALAVVLDLDVWVERDDGRRYEWRARGGRVE